MPNHDSIPPEVRDMLREQHLEERREAARQKKAEKRAAQRAARRESNQRSKSLPWICRFDNALHDFFGQPRNY
jgi:hypothetical protein